MAGLTYLENSGFALEMGDTLLAFDVCSDRAVPGRKGLDGGVLDAGELARFARRALFFSHSHGDHYCRQAFALEECEKYISYEFPPAFPGTRLRPGEQVEQDGLKVRAFGSTDLGVSFFVEYKGKGIFHAGDFNLWHWREESTQAEIEEAYALYQGVLETLLPLKGKIDLCFFPVDPRMGRTTMEGALDFCTRLEPKITVPMHMQGDGALGRRFVGEMERKGLRAVCLPKRGDRVDIWND